MNHNVCGAPATQVTTNHCNLTLEDTRYHFCMLLESATALESGDPAANPLSYWKHYDEFISRHQIEPRTILEVGIWKGQSSQVLSNAFPESKIVGIDIDLSRLAGLRLPNVTFVEGDQTSPQDLDRAIQQFGSNGIDLVIDDSAHFGFFSETTFWHLFPHVRSGGGYCIEDWGTGYWSNWPDGSEFKDYAWRDPRDNLPTHRENHSSGMVGFVKSLVDLTHEGAIRASIDSPSTRSSRLRSLEFREGVCMAIKA